MVHGVAFHNFKYELLIMMEMVLSWLLQPLANTILQSSNNAQNLGNSFFHKNTFKPSQ